MTVTLVALGLAIYPSTQLRFGGLPFGPGEFLLAVWVGLAALQQMMRPRISGNLALARVTTFWAVLLLAECAGTIVGLATEPFQYYRGMAHDVLAYALVFTVACMFALDLDDPGRRRRVAWQIVVFGTVSMMLQIASGRGVFPLPGVDPWFYDRLRGWSLDPNQLGFYAMFLLFLEMHLAETASRPREAVAALACGLPAFAVGLLSQSDTFRVALMPAVSVFLVLKSITWLKMVDMPTPMRGMAVALGLLSLPLAVASVVPFWSAVVIRVEQQSDALYAKDGQGALRLQLWREAYEKGLASGMIGLGPGPHLTSTKEWKMPPPYKFEAHNTPLDLFTQGGFLALAVFVWFCASTLREGWRARLPALSAMVMGVSVSSMFFFWVRHPNFWFAVVLCLLEAGSARDAYARPIRSEVWS